MLHILTEEEEFVKDVASDDPSFNLDCFSITQLSAVSITAIRLVRSEETSFGVSVCC
jgi:hypothetical protein